MTAGLEFAGRDCPVPAPHAAAQPSMIGDRGDAARESSSASLTARTAWYPQRAPASPPLLRSGLFPPCRKGNHGRHLDVRCCMPESVELLRVQEHHRAARAGVEGGRIERTALALHGHDVPAIEATDPATPLPGGSPHCAPSLTNLSPAGESSTAGTEPLDKCVPPVRRLRSVPSLRSIR